MHFINHWILRIRNSATYRVKTHLTKIQRSITLRKALNIQKKFALPEVPLPGTASSAEPNYPFIFDDVGLPCPQTNAAHDDLTPLLRIAKWLDARTIIELGTAYGNTVANLCAQCPSAHIYTVNATEDQMTGDVTTFSLTNTAIGRVYRSHGYSDRVTQVLCDTLDLDLAPHMRGDLADLAIIDACHDLRYVLNDFHKVMTYIKPGGVVLFHDTHASMKGHLLDSYLACMQLRSEGYNICHIADTWWGIWIKDCSIQSRNALTLI